MKNIRYAKTWSLFQFWQILWIINYDLREIWKITIYLKNIDYSIKSINSFYDNKNDNLYLK